MKTTDFERRQTRRKPPFGDNGFEMLVEEIHDTAIPLREVRDMEPLIDRLKDARIVMLGEASHGTQEFYEWRRLISAWLITHHGFDFIAVEGDWPPCWELSRYVRGEVEGNAESVLRGFRRWPTWMWANTEVARLGEWMRSHNATHEQQIGFYGLDVYSLFESMDAVLANIRLVDPEVAEKIANAYSCFDLYRHDEKAYARSLTSFPEGCEEQVHRVIQQFSESLRGRLFPSDVGAYFDLEQNARVVKNAESYYRTMILGGEDSWNVRDRHMIETLDALLERRGRGSKAIVWAHNTHVGDYRATDMYAHGLVNIGGLAREKWGKENVALVGFGTHQGEVVASRAWGGKIETLPVPEGRPDSIEAAFHRASSEMSVDRNFVIFDDRREGPFRDVRGHRAIGVVYNPEYERYGNYVPTSLAERYDAFMFFDRTGGVKPLLDSDDVNRKAIPETWPRGE
jgi:erythromycin esterase-like protein